MFTDPDRMADVVAAAERLPRGAGIVHRGFGRPGAADEALALSRLARRRGLVLLIGQDAALAARVGAHGVHLPERDLRHLPRLRRQRPHWIVTVAAHSTAALARAGRAGAHGAFLSAVFPSRSPSAGRPLGVTRLAAMVRTATVPVLALGGVGPRTVARLKATGVAGFAAVEAIGRSRAGKGGVRT
jgi:thiamine-phosphate pyrophosphorylase